MRRLAVIPLFFLAAPASAEPPCGSDVPTWDVDLIASQARIVPAFHHGTSEGFKLYSIRPGSWAALAGLANGDRVITANGQDLSTPDKALQLYQALISRRTIVLEIVRSERRLWIESAFTMPGDACGERTDALADLVRLRREVLRHLAARDAASTGWRPSPLHDPWSRPYQWLEPHAADEPGCLFSLGPDGLPGTEDDLRLACDLDLLNHALMLDAARACSDDRKDAWGGPIVLRPTGNSVAAWSFGPDRAPDTADDRMAQVAGAFCAELLRVRGVRAP